VPGGEMALKIMTNFVKVRGISVPLSAFKARSGEPTFAYLGTCTFTYYASQPQGILLATLFS